MILLGIVIATFLYLGFYPNPKRDRSTRDLSRAALFVTICGIAIGLLLRHFGV